MAKSNVTMFRKLLKVKGKSEHSGRGFFWFGYDCTKEEVERRIRKMVNDHPLKFNIRTDNERELTVLAVTQDGFDQYYRMLAFDKSTGELIVLMVLPS